MGHIHKLSQNSVVLDRETTRIANQTLVNVSRESQDKLTLMNCFLSTPMYMGEIHAEGCTITAATLPMLKESSTLIGCTVITKPNQSAAELSKYIHDKFNATSTNATQTRIMSFATKEGQEVIKAAHDACVEGKVSALRTQFCLPATYYDREEIIGTPTPLNVVATDGRKNITAWARQQKQEQIRLGNDTPIFWANSSGIIPGIPLTTNERIFALNGGYFAVYQKVGVLNEWTQEFLASGREFLASGREFLASGREFLATIHQSRLAQQGTCWELNHEPAPNTYFPECSVGDTVHSPTKRFIVGCAYIELASLPSGARNAQGTITATLTAKTISTLTSMADAAIEAMIMQRERL